MNRSRQMAVGVKVELTAPADQKNICEVRSAAMAMTDDKQSVHVSFVADDPRAMIAGFTMTKARQMDVVDKIMNEFALFMENYNTQSVWFPHLGRKRTQKRKANTPTQGMPRVDRQP